jgi:tRNA pseudouridine55 synthase
VINGVPLHGLFCVNKPAGITSRAAVDHVQRLARPAKVGHAGTLDPLASGVLVIAVGAATRLIEYVQQMPKTYQAKFLLGRRSDTDDIEGEVTELDNPPLPTLDEVRTAAQGLTGEILQRPPVYSAVKIAGRRAYALARQGKPVEPAARHVSVYRLDVDGYEYPELGLQIECGSGTYVRSLGRDLAEGLGTAAVMSRLVRTAIGSFRIEDAIELESLQPDAWTVPMQPMLRAVEHLPRVELDAEEIIRVRAGQLVSDHGLRGESGELAGLDSAGQLVAILVRRGPEVLGPVRNLS